MDAHATMLSVAAICHTTPRQQWRSLDNGGEHPRADNVRYADRGHKSSKVTFSVAAAPTRPCRLRLRDTAKPGISGAVPIDR